MNNQLLEKLQQGQQTVGTFFAMGNATAAECLGLAGLDYLIIDSEHGPFDIESALEIIRGAELKNITALARVKDSSRASILKMLDIGLAGLIIPDVRSLAEVQRIVDYGKYFPLGQRGVALPRCTNYSGAATAAELQAYMDSANRSTLLLPQCETKECLDNIEEIAALPGVDGIFVGPFDLSVALKKPAQFADGEFTAAVERILAACRAAHKYCFTFAMDAAGAQRWFAQGFDSVAIATDASIFISAVRQLVAEAKK